MSIFTSNFFWKFLIKNQLTHPDPKRIGGGKCPPSCQLKLKQFLPLFSVCDDTCTGANRECDVEECKCSSGYKVDTANSADTDPCIAQGKKSLTTDEANPQVSKDLEKCQKSHTSS